MNEIAFEFWDKYYKTDNELERRKLLEQLPIFKQKNGKIRLLAYGASVSLLLSYFDDIFAYCERRESGNA